MRIEKTYSIIRFYAPAIGKEPEVRLTGLTIDEALDYCSDEATHVPGEWFDGYRAE